MGMPSCGQSQRLLRWQHEQMTLWFKQYVS